MSRRSVAALVLLVGALQAHAACNCNALPACTGCVPVEEGDECYNQCQWCIPKLTCQQCPEVTNPRTNPPTYDCTSITDQCSKVGHGINAVIGPHQAFKCQDVQGDGPTLMSVSMESEDKTVQLWNGTIPSGTSIHPTGIPTAGDPSGSIVIQGQHWGSDVSAADIGTNQILRLCPFINMDAAVPVGPSPMNCVNCSSYASHGNLDLHLCGFLDDATKTTQCSKITCDEIPAGIGEVSVFLDVKGEPASVVALQNALTAPQYRTPLASFSYAAPKITSFATPQGDCALKDAKTRCTARAGDEVTITADNLPATLAIAEAYNSWAPGLGLSVLIGNTACENMKLDTAKSVLTCTLPVSSGGKLAIRLTVGGQVTEVPDLFYYPAPQVLSVSPTVIPSWGQEITIKGSDFAVGGTVSLNYGNTELPCSSPVNYTVSTLTCLAPRSDSLDDQHAVIVVSTLSGASTSTKFVDYKGCAFKDVNGGLCVKDGTQLCDRSFSCIHNAAEFSGVEPTYNEECDFASASCVCKLDASDCLNGGTYDAKGCNCMCQNGYSSSGKGGQPIPDTVPQGIYSGLCDACEVSCGSLDKKVQTADKCGCEFNGLNVIWIVLLVVIALGAAGFGAFKYREMQKNKDPLPLGEYLKVGNDEEEARESRGDSAAYM